jgi:hypothetical protein
MYGQQCRDCRSARREARLERVRFVAASEPGFTRAEIVAYTGESREFVREALGRVRARGEWTPDEIATLRAGYARGESDALIARRLGRSATRIWQKAHALGLAKAQGPRWWSEREVRILRAGVAQGRSAAWVSARTDRTVPAVRKKAHQLGLLFSRRPG